jgi:hypothetical protein
MDRRYAAFHLTEFMGGGSEDPAFTIGLPRGRLSEAKPTSPPLTDRALPLDRGRPLLRYGSTGGRRNDGTGSTSDPLSSIPAGHYGTRSL